MVWSVLRPVVTRKIARINEPWKRSVASQSSGGIKLSHALQRVNALCCIQTLTSSINRPGRIPASHKTTPGALENQLQQGR